MKLRGGPPAGISAQAPKNYSRSDRNLPYAQDALDNTVSRANRQYVEAINVDGVRYLHWSKAMEGFVCTCKKPKDEAIDGSLTELPAQSLDPSSSPSILDWDALSVRHVKDPIQMRDDGAIEMDNGTIYGKDNDNNDREDTTVRIDFNVDEEYDNLIDENSPFIKNALAGLGSPFITGEARCGICIDTGLVNGYKLTGGDRIILDASGQIPIVELATFALDKQAAPYLFTASGAINSYVSWLVELPTYFMRALSVAVRNNVDPARGVSLEYKLAEESGDYWMPLTVEALNSRKGLRTKMYIRVRSNVNDLDASVKFTHVEINLQYKDWPQLQMPPLSENINPAAFDSLFQMSFILPPTQQMVKPHDLFYTAKYDRMWFVLDTTDSKTAKNQVLGWQVNVRVLTESEAGQTLRVVRDPEFGIAFAKLGKYKDNTFSKEDTLNYTETFETAHEKARLAIRSLTLKPQTGEFILETNGVYRNGKLDNYHVSGVSYLEATVSYFKNYYPNLSWVWIEPSWFGTDLRCGLNQIRPGVKNNTDTTTKAWLVNGINRASAVVNSASSYDSTYDDASLVSAIKFLKAAGYKVGIKPKLLMDITAAQNLPNPGGVGVQPKYPFASGITYNNAGTANAEVDSFFGPHSITDLIPDATLKTTTVTNNPNVWGYKRFVFHYMQLANMAGGVDAFIIGSKLSGLTLRSTTAISHLSDILTQGKTLLSCMFSYEASASEYGGQISGNAISFPLDTLWTDSDVAFVAISYDCEWTDWRSAASLDGQSYLSIYDVAYLRSRIAGGINYNYEYLSAPDRTNEVRTAITDWRKRKKAFVSWMENEHIVRNSSGVDLYPTSWSAFMKPIAFTDFSIPAIDKGTNGPYESSELLATDVQPYFSTGSIDASIQQVATYAFLTYWLEKNYNPSDEDGRPAVAINLNSGGAFNIVDMIRDIPIHTASNRHFINGKI